MKMIKLAKHILAVADNNGIAVNELHLQKIMYFAMQDYLQRHGSDKFITEVYSNPFQTWKYGPGCFPVYVTFSLYGSSDLTDLAEYSAEYAVFDDKIKELLAIDPFELVDRSRQEAFYQQADTLYTEYTLADILAG